MARNHFFPWPASLPSPAISVHGSKSSHEGASLFDVSSPASAHTHDDKSGSHQSLVRASRFVVGRLEHPACGQCRINAMSTSAASTARLTSCLRASAARIIMKCEQVQRMTFCCSSEPSQWSFVRTIIAVILSLSTTTQIQHYTSVYVLF